MAVTRSQTRRQTRRQAPKKTVKKTVKKATKVKGAKKARMIPVTSPTDSMTLDAVMAVAPPKVADSLARKGYSRTIDASIGEVMHETKNEYKNKVAGQKRKRSGSSAGGAKKKAKRGGGGYGNMRMDWSGAGLPRTTRYGTKHAKKHTAKKGKRGGGGYRNMRVNWSGSGVPHAGSTKGVCTEARVAACHAKGLICKGARCHKPAAEKQADAKGACGKPCAPNKRAGISRVRNPTTCRCMKSDVAMRTIQGECAPRKSKKDGRLYATVRRDIGGGRFRCVKAGGATAKKAVGGNKSCPPGKKLVSYRTRVPDRDGIMYSVNATRCVLATGKFKDCTTDKVLVSVPSSGKTPKGKLWAKNVQKCVTPEFAQAKGYRVLRRGTLPPPAFTGELRNLANRRRRARPAKSPQRTYWTPAAGF